MWTFGGGDASNASAWFGLHHARLKAVVLQLTVVSSFGGFVLQSLFSSASFSKLPPLLRFFSEGSRWLWTQGRRSTISIAVGEGA